MRDRPMRLKYLTKMKIILCIFLLYITAVSVFGQSVPLDGILGESVKFPAAVKKGGRWMYRNVKLGDVTDSKFQRGPNGKYTGRLHWDSNTGYFSLSELEMEDSGEYEVQNTDQNINTIFQLNVYKDNVPVSKPHVNVTRNEYRCTVLCIVERGTGVTLSWYREGEEKPYGSYPVRDAPYLDLPQTVDKGGNYTCEAKNSVSNEKASITLEAHCTAPIGSNTVTVVLSVVIAVLFVTLIVVLICFQRHRAKSERQVKEFLHSVI